jgi:hypothetical protein
MFCHHAEKLVPGVSSLQGFPPQSMTTRTAVGMVSEVCWAQSSNKLALACEVCWAQSSTTC